MRGSRLGGGIVLAVLTLFAPMKARAACTKDSDCASHLICVRGHCASPVDPGTSVAPGTIGASDRRRGACLHKCDQANSKCLSKVRSVELCVSQRRKNCVGDCQKKGGTAKACTKQCTATERTSSWRPECAAQGDSARQSCVQSHDNCLRTCGTIS